MPDWIVALIGALLSSVMTQILSNAATAGILLPILRDLSLRLEVNPLLFMFPSMLMASYSFSLPVSTAPNAMAFRSSGLSTIDMLKVGTPMNFACLVIVMASIMTYGQPMYDLSEFPDWAAEASNVNQTDLCGYI